MPKYKVKNNETGATVSFNWETTDREPDDDDLENIFKAQHEKSKATIDKVATSSLKLSPLQSLGMKANEWIQHGNIIPGTNTPSLAHVVDSAEQYLPSVANLARLKDGVYQTVHGQELPDDDETIKGASEISPIYAQERAANKNNPAIKSQRELGVNKALQGGLGLLTPALGAGGLAGLPRAAMGILAGTAASEGAGEVSDLIGLSPERKQTIQNALGLITGGMVGHTFGKLPGIKNPFSRNPSVPAEPLAEPVTLKSSGAKVSFKVDPETGESVEPEPEIKPIESPEITPYQEKTLPVTPAEGVEASPERPNPEQTPSNPETEVSTGESAPVAGPEVPEELAKTPEVKEQAVPETKEESASPKDYYEALNNIDPRTEVSDDLIRHAGKQKLTPQMFEEDLRDYGANESAIDNAVKKAFPTNYFEQAAKESAPEETQMGAVLSPFTIAKRYANYGIGWVRNMDEFFERHKIAGPIVKQMRTAFYGANGENEFKYKVNSEFSDIFNKYKGSNDELKNFLDGTPSTNPEVTNTGSRIKAVFDSIHQQAITKGIRKPGIAPVTLSDYIGDLATDNSMWDAVKAEFNHIVNKGPATVSSGKGMELIEKDLPTIIRRYINAQAKLQYRFPVYKSGMEALKNIDDPFEKEHFDWMMKRYVGLDKRSQTTALNNLDKALYKGAMRGLLGGSLKIQRLHLTKLATQIFPEVGPWHMTQGLADVVQDMRGAYKEAQRKGLINSTPRKFKGKFEDFDSLLNYADIANNFVKMATLKANQSRLKAAGDPNWETNAAYEAARQEGFVNPTSQIRVLDANLKFVTALHHFAFKYANQYASSLVRTVADKNPKAFATTLTLAGMYYMTRQLGINHIKDWNPYNPFSATPQQRTIGRAFKHLVVDRDPEAAYKDVALLFTPGSHAVYGKTEDDSEPHFHFPQMLEGN